MNLRTSFLITRFPSERHKPLGQLRILATGVGFEPTHELPRLTDFESALFSRLSNPPSWHPRRESNPDQEIRSLLPYPLDHEGTPQWWPGVESSHPLLIFSQTLSPFKLPGHVVWVEGFEPPTSCSQGRRTTKLSYTQIMVQTDGLEPPTPSL